MRKNVINAKNVILINAISISRNSINAIIAINGKYINAINEKSINAINSAIQ